MSSDARGRLAAWEHVVLRSVAPVIGRSRWVATDREALATVARWMAWEEFAPADPVAIVAEQVPASIDHTLVTTAIDFAFTDFATRVPFTADAGGARLVDAEAMFLRVDEALAAGVPLLDGAWLAQVTPDVLAKVFHGPTPMPLLPERAAVLNGIGRVLVERYGGRFHRFVASCPPRCYAGGEGLLERLVTEFDHFADVSEHDGAPVHLYKLAQLGVWTLHRTGAVVLDDLAALTAFADYIVPAALRAMGVLHYHPDLAAAIDAGDEIARDSAAEVELRAHTVWATALLTEQLNAIRPPELAVVIPQVDYRLWKAYHAHIRPHHLTRTVMY